MAKKNVQAKKVSKRTKLLNEERIIDLLERLGVGLLYVGTKLGQNNIAQIMGMGDSRVNEILKDIEKPNNL